MDVVLAFVLGLALALATTKFALHVVEVIHIVGVLAALAIVLAFALGKGVQVLLVVGTNIVKTTTFAFWGKFVRAVTGIVTRMTTDVASIRG